MKTPAALRALPLAALVAAMWLTRSHHFASAVHLPDASWAAFEQWRKDAGSRLILFTTRASLSYLDHAFRPEDVLLFGRESSGVPDAVHSAADARLIIPMRAHMRSLNVASCWGLVLPCPSFLKNQPTIFCWNLPASIFLAALVARREP